MHFQYDLLERICPNQRPCHVEGPEGSEPSLWAPLKDDLVEKPCLTLFNHLNISKVTIYIYIYIHIYIYIYTYIYIDTYIYKE